MDFSLDLNKASPTYGDLLMINGDFVLTSDGDPRGTNPVLQSCLQRLRYIWKEWFLNNTNGIPYFQQIFVRNPDQAKIDAILVNVIAGTNGIQTILMYQSTIDTVDRILNVKFRAQSTSGIISWSGNFPVTGGTTS